MVTQASLIPAYKNRVQLWHSIAKKAKAYLDFDQLLKIYQAIYQHDEVPVVWLPDHATLSNANLTRFMQAQNLKNYQELHRWSVTRRADFWEATIKQLNIKLTQPYASVLDLSQGNENPVWLPGARLNIAQSCFQQNPEKTAIISSNEKGRKQPVTYGELEKLSNQVASGLVNSGLQPKDRVILYLPLSLEAVAAYLGTIKAGLEAVLVADSFSASELSRRATMIGAKLVFTSDAYWYGGKTLPIYQKVKDANAPKAVVIPYDGNSDLRNKDIFWKDFLGSEVFTDHIADPYDTTSILFSSGTTNEPKAIPWNHLTPIKCAADGYFHQDVHPSDVITWTTGMGWMMGPWAIFAALINGATLALFIGSGATETFGKFVQDAHVTILGTIPSLVKVWRKTRLMEKFNWSVRVLSSTGEPSNTDDYLYLMYLADFKAPVIEYCGGTEIGGGYMTGTVVQPAAPATFTTPTLGLEVKFLNDNGEAAQLGESGEVFLVPPSIGLSQSLLNRDHHEEYFEGMPADENGNLLRKHGDNYKLIQQPFEITHFYKSQGRADDVMNLGGIKVSAVEIEKVLNEHEWIFESAAIGVAPDDGGPEQLVIYYVPKDKIISEETLKKELRKMLSAELNPLFRIAEIRQQTALPRTASNKLMRRSLKKDYFGRKES